MKTILKSALIGLSAAIGGWVVVSFLTLNLFNGTSKEAGSVFGWGMYLTCVVAVCTGVIVAKLNKK